ncbi:peptidoglycan bridge formation glycyltransferase FemA/FemB family protein, partial [Candidatus Gottesmanbacteria bacterium]|nr:peptidoglycan bridge formation glycyltransferase FemA/FemB family protein [Candidatus Gottesmanbacteria bacterium]
MAHLLQSEEWSKFRQQTPNIKKVLKIGSNYVYIHRVPYLPFTVAYFPRPEKTENLEEIKEACRKEKTIFLKIEPSIKFDQLDQFVKSKPVLPQRTIYIDLTKSEDELLKKMHEKTRYNIRLAQKKGV